MAKIDQKDLELLAEIVVKNIKAEFEIKHLSRNLVNTMRIENLGNEIKIYIPAQTYNMLLFRQKGVVVHTSHGSYASKLDQEGSSFMIYPGDTRKGSFRTKPGNHKGFVEKVIQESIREWNGMLKKYKIKQIEER